MQNSVKKNTKGITLIALVVTIVILIILATTSIYAIFGENGLINQSKRAKEETEKARKNEISDFANLESMINEHENNINILQVTDQNPGQLEQEDIDTLVINSIEDLIFFSHDVTNGNKYEEKTVKLGVNLDFNSDKSYVNPNRTDFVQYGYNGPLKQSLISGEGFAPIGELSYTGTNYFYGTFDGNNKVICSLYIHLNRDENVRVGFFSNTYGIISNLGLINTNISVKGTRTAVGGITGTSYNNIYNSYVSGNINVIGSSWMSVGGLCGEMLVEKYVDNCYNLANIECKNILEGYGSADITCGGILGQRYANINRCYNKGNISVDGGDNDVLIGGICGSLRLGAVKNCYNNSKIEFISTNEESGTVNAGGFCGSIATEGESSIINCYNAGEIIGNGVNKIVIGGIIAYQRYNTDIRNVFNLGKMVGKGNSTVVGGIIGMEDGEGARINSAYNTGKIERNNRK